MFLFLLTENNTMSGENIQASLTCQRTKMPPRRRALAAGAIILCRSFISKQLSFKINISWNVNTIPSRILRVLRKHFFPYCVDQWNKVKLELRKEKPICKFKKSIITVKQENSLYNVHNSVGVKLLSHLRAYFFRDSFSDTVNCH